MRRTLGRLGLAIALLGAAVLGDATPAEARKVANPGAGFALTVPSGFLRIRSNAFDYSTVDRAPECADGVANDGGQDGAIDFPADPQCTSATDDSEVAGGFQPQVPITMTNGSVTAAGAVTFPAGSVTFPPRYLYNDSPPPVDPFVTTVQVIPTHDVTGTLNPITGAMSLRLRIRMSITGGPLAAGCGVGTAGAPIDVNALITGTTAPPGPNTPITGSPYQPGTGRARLVANAFSVPSASSCGTYAFFVDLNDEIDNSLGLPSPAGNNEIQLTVDFGDVRPQPGVVASFTTTPSSGIAPLTVGFDAGGSTGELLTYQWDFTNNGSFDASGVQTSFSYPSPGTYTARLRATDEQGDFAETTKTITATNRKAPVLVLSSSLDPAPAGAGTVKLKASRPVGDKTAPIPTGTVDFVIGGTPTRVALNGSGVATLRLPLLLPGEHLIRAVYSGDSTYLPGERERQQVVTLADTVTTLTTSTNTKTGLDTLKASVKRKAPSTGYPTGGEVLFTADGSTIGSVPLVQGKAILKVDLAPGTVVVAHYSGDPYGNPSQSLPRAIP